jgi:hypothetical protein
MSRLYKRYCDLTVEGGPGELNLSDFRIHFEIDKNTIQTPNPAVIRIYNISRSTAAKIKQDYKTITIDAGYEENHGVIYRGNIRYTRYGRESPTDTFLDIYGGEGDSGLKNAGVSKTLPAGSTPKHIKDAALEALKEHGIEEGYIGPDLSQPRFPRPIVLYGMARDILRTLASSKDATFSIQSGKLDIIEKKSEGKPGSDISLNADTGLIGMPVETSGGIMVRALINPNFFVDGKVKIDQKSIQELTPEFPQGTNNATSGSSETNLTPEQQLIKQNLGSADGVYRVLYIRWTGDTHGREWYADLTCVGAVTGKAFSTSLIQQRGLTPQFGN